MSVIRSRRGKAHWQQLVELQSASGLSGAEFCRQHDVKYASFMNWRKRLKLPKNNPTPAPTNAFVELTAPAASASALGKDAMADTTLCVELSLGAGIELRISRQG